MDGNDSTVDIFNFKLGPNVCMPPSVGGGGLLGVDEDNGMELQQSCASADGATAAAAAPAAPVEVESHRESDGGGGEFLRQQMQHHQG